MDDMQYYEVAPTRIIRPDKHVFTYGYEGKLARGQLVVVEIGRTRSTGVVMRSVKAPEFSTKLILSTVEETPLPTPLLDLATWMSSYYASHLALTLQTFLPRGLHKNRRERKDSKPNPIRDRTKFVLNKHQMDAVEKVQNMSPGTVILHGITGSGKTAIYINLAKRMVSEGKSVIVLVPEIALTTQLLDDFAAEIDNILVTHSQQTEAARHDAWLKALNEPGPQVVIGPRSALFMPLADIGLIVIDEAHEPSFKQEQTPRYSALRAASVLAQSHRAKLILGSATPLVSDYFLAARSESSIITLDKTARPARIPAISLVDLTDRSKFKRHRFLSDKLLEQIESALERREQALVFHNRRGSAHTTLCKQCGWHAACERCFVPLTLHIDKHSLQCHICGYSETVPTTCPACGGADIIHKGIGTKLIEDELRKLFPSVTIGRFDADSGNESIDKVYDQLYSGKIQIIIGTQVVAKGLDLPNLRTVGIIQADAGLSLPDFGSTERTFQLLTQAIGRVGRSNHDTSVIVQTYQPSHPAIVDSLSQNYIDFYKKTLAERRRANFPPYCFLLKLLCIYKTEAAAVRNSRDFARHLRQKYGTEIEILGPTPAFYERQHDSYRWQLVIKSKKRSVLEKIASDLPSAHWQFELDPTSLL